MISKLKWGQKDGGGLTVEDVDWVNSDKPVVVMNDGSVRIYDLNLLACQSEITLAEFKGYTLFSIHL